MVSRLPPEILQDIFRYNLYPRTPRYRNLIKSCLLVNRYWCYNAISIIWEEPLNVCAQSVYGRKDPKDNIIRVYITNLPRESKALLRDVGIDSSAISERSISTFNYASFLQKIDLQGLHEVSTCWIMGSKYYTSSRYNEIREKRLLLFRELCKLFISQSPNLKFSIILDDIKWDEFSHFQQLSDVIPPNSSLEYLACHTSHVNEMYESIGRMFTEIKCLDISREICNSPGLVSLIDQMHETTWSLSISGTPGLPMIEALKKKIHLLTSLTVASDESAPLKIFAGCRFLRNLKIYDDIHEDFSSPSVVETFADFSFNQLIEFHLHSERSVDLSLISNIIGNSHKTIQTLHITCNKEVENHALLLSSTLPNFLRLKELSIPLTRPTLDLIFNIFRTCIMLRTVTLCWYDGPIEPQSEMLNWAENLGKSIPLSLQSLRVEKCMGLNFEAFDRFLNQCCVKKVKSLELTIEDWLYSEVDPDECIKMIDRHIAQGTLHANSRLKRFNVM